MEGIISEERKKWIEELSEVIGRADSFLKEACEHYSWDIKDLEKVAEENYMTCPFDKSHVVPEKSMHRHLESCEWRTLGYTKDCKPLPESAIPAESPFTIKFDMELQLKVLQEAKQKDPQLDIGTDEKLIPQTSDRLTSDFTRDERKAMYEYVVAHTLAPDLGQDITDLNKPEKQEERNASLLELLAQERNLKRRKTKYRGVHTNKKSHVEIMREVVQQQMEMYKEYLAEKYGISIPDEDQENSSNNIKDKALSSTHTEFSSSKRRSQDRSRESHRSYSKDYSDKSRESHRHYSRDYTKSSRHSSQYEDRDYKSHSKHSSRRLDCRDEDEYDYKSRDKYEDKNYSGKHSNKSKFDDTKEYRDSSKSSRDYKDSGNNYKKEKDTLKKEKDTLKKEKDTHRDKRKRDRSSSVDKKSNSKLKEDSYSRKNDKKHENGHKSKKHKSDKSSKEKKHKKSKHKHKNRSRSRS